MLTVRIRCAVVVVCLLMSLGTAGAAPIGRAKEPVKDRYIVTVASGTSDVEEVAKALAAAHEGKLLAVWKHAVKGFWIEMPAANAARLAADRRVATIEEDAVMHSSAEGTQQTGKTGPDTDLPQWNPDDPLAHLTRISHRVRPPSGSALSLYKYRYSNDGSYDNGKRVRVYVIDVGIWAAHKEFQRDGVSSIVAGFSAAHQPNFQRKTENLPADPNAPKLIVDPIPVDLSPTTNPCQAFSNTPPNRLAHGTAVASMIVGQTVGVAKGAEVVSVTNVACEPIGQSPYHNSAALFVSALDWVREEERRRTTAATALNPKPPAVLSLSSFRFAEATSTRPAENCGVTDTACEVQTDLTVLEEAITAVVESGIPVVVSANNQNADACLTTPGRLGQRGGRLTSNQRVITVGAMDGRNDIPWFFSDDPDNENLNRGSNWGQCVDIWAPGSHLPVAFPGNDNTTAETKRYSAAHSGTSYSAPIVAGIIARMLAESPALRDTQDNMRAAKVWELLKANATPFPDAAPAGRLSSPKRMAYLGGVMFASQPPAEKFAAPASQVTLTAPPVFEPTLATKVCYQWYRGQPETTTEPIDGATNSTFTATAPASGSEQYWVRVGRKDIGSAGTCGVAGASFDYYADSNPIKVTASATCTLPAITTQPVTQWLLTPQSVELTASVTSAANLYYQWLQIDGPNAVMVGHEGPVIGSVVSVNITPPPGASVTTYRLRLCAGATCSAVSTCVVESDTAQIRVLPPVSGATIRATTSNGFKTVAVVGDPPPQHRLRWHYRPSPESPWQVLRYNLTPEETEAARAIGGTGIPWMTFRGEEHYTTLPGEYQLEIGNVAGTTLSNVVDVSAPNPFRLQVLDPRYTLESWLEEHTLANAIISLPYNSRATLRVRPFWPVAHVPTPRITYSWNQGPPSSLPYMQTGQIVGPAQYEVKAKDLRSGHERTFVFKLAPTEDNHCVRPIFVNDSVCRVISNEPTYRIRANTEITFRPSITDQNGVAIPAFPAPGDTYALSEFDFDWTIKVEGVTGEIKQSGKGLDTYKGTFTRSARIVLVVTDPAQNCVDRLTIHVVVDTKKPACPTTCQWFCKRPAVRHGDSEGGSIPFNPGDTAIFSAPEEEAGYSYTWYRQSGGGAPEIIGTTGSIHVVLITPSQYWVETDTGTQTFDSERLVTYLMTGSAADVTVTPLYRTVEAGQPTSFTASFAGANATTTYEWRMGDSYTLYMPVIGTEPTLTIADPQWDMTYWCRVTHTVDGETRHYYSDFVVLAVQCNPEIGGVLHAQAQYVARNESTRINATGSGKVLQYSWWKRLPNDATRNPIGSWWDSIRPTVTDPETWFGATVVDACGQSATFTEVPIYLCVPTITQEPVGTVVAPNGSATLSVAATPAIDGQPLNVTWHLSTDGVTSLGTGWTFTTPPSTTQKSYYAAIHSECAGYDHVKRSQSAIIAICASPTITNQNNLVMSTSAGSSHRLLVVASGSELTYQWYVGESGNTASPIAGQIAEDVYVHPTTTTRYWCRVTSQGACTTDSGTIEVRVCETPTITTQPQNALIFSGSTTTLSVVADAGFNTQPLTYQWQHSLNGEWWNVSGATSASFTTPPLTAETLYRVSVKAGICEISSNAATVSICTYPQSVPASPAETKIAFNGTATLPMPVLSPVASKTIRWYRGAVGDTTNLVRTGINVSYTTPALTTTTTYWAEIEHNGCISRTTAYTVTVCVPAFTTEPTGTTIASGSSHSMTVATTALPGTQSFQWFIGNPGTTTNPIAGATSANLSVSPTATTTYWCRVTSACGLTANSAAATVTVCNAPVITGVSPTRFVESSTPASVTVSATGTDLTYQWYAGASGNTASPVSGATSSSAVVSPTADTTYWCRVKSSGLCATDSAAILVDVCTKPTITTQPVSSRIFSGKPTTLTVAATSPGPLTYQWYSGAATQIAGATSASMTVSPTAETSYWVRVSTSVCQIDSQAAVLSMCTYPEVVNAAVANTNIASGQSVNLSIPMMSPVDNKFVRWYRGASGDKTNLVGSGQNAGYATGPLTATTQYWAEIEHNTCFTRTTTYTVSVCLPSFTTQPAGNTIASGSSHSMTVATTALPGTQTYQWFIGDAGTTTNQIAGATSTNLSVSPTATTTYWCRVTSDCGLTANSTAATVTVCNAPVITSVSPTRNIESSTSTSVVVTATGTNLTYQWYSGASGNTASPVPGATSSSAVVSPTADTTYWCRVKSSGLCATDSAAILVDVCTKPTITTQPVSSRIFSGKPTTLTVAATSPGPLTYQWYSGAATPIAGATSASVTVSPTAETSYWVRVSTSVCSIDSQPAVLSMCTYPEVVNAAVANTNIASGQSVNLSIPVMSPVETKFVRWYRGASGDKTNLVGSGQNAGYATGPLTATTQYWAEIEHNTCFTRTTTYTVSVCLPTITTQPQSSVIQPNQQKTLTVAASGSPLTYQWYTGTSGNTSAPISGATSASYTTPALTATTSYWVRVSGCTTADSATATVTVCANPAVTNLTKTGVNTINGTGTITVTATGPTLSYQWYKGQSGVTTQPLSGATAAAYTFTLSASDFYWVRVTSACSGLSVDSAAIFYDVKPKIIQQPSSVTIGPNSTATFSLVATGNYLSYQWFNEALVAINGATSPTFTTPPLAVETTYHCRVMTGTASASTISSAMVTATICDGPELGWMSTQLLSGNSWKIKMNGMDPGSYKFHWYKGPAGNAAVSVDLGENTNFITQAVTQTSTFWVRVWLLDDSCYSDSPGVTVP